MTFTLDARALTDWQTCRRRYLLNTDYRPVRWRAKSLFDACLRRAIVQLSTGRDPAEAATEARAEFMQAASNPGLDIVGVSPYAVAKEWCVMFDTILRALGKTTILTMKEAPAARLNTQFEWRPLAFADDSGALHRWITVDAWTEDDLAREMHSWYVIGDMVALGVPMTLHVVIIGQERKGRRASPWARAYKNPAMPSLRYRFKRSESSEAAWLVDMPGESPDEWVERMYKEGAAQALVQHAEVMLPDARVCTDTVGQMLREGIAMRDATTDRESIPWSAWPMSRGACDLWVPCYFQACCYPTTQPETLNLYQPRQARATVPA